MTDFRNIILFDLDASGHHPSYLMHLASYHLTQDQPFRLVAIVSPAFFEKYPNIIEQFGLPNNKVIWQSISHEEWQNWQNQPSALKKTFYEWALFCKYASAFEAIHGILMYIDHLQPAILTQQKAPCTFSGILFRPTLQYYQPDSLKERINYIRKNITLRLLLGKKQLVQLFSLDPFAAEYIQQNWNIPKVTALPDPVEVFPPSDIALPTFKQSLGIAANKKIFLIFGFLDSRKGIGQMMDAIEALPDSLADKGSLLIVGNWEATERKLFDEKRKALEIKPKMQIVLVDRFIYDEEINIFFAVSDYIIALYQKHIGMSGVMVRAALAQKPIITYQFGLMGQMVQAHELGISLDIHNKKDLQEKIQFLLETKQSIGDTAKMQAFAQINTDKNYAKTLLKKVYNLVG